MANKSYAHKRTKLSAKTRRNYDRQAKHKPVDRYEPPKITKKANKAAAVAKVNECQYVAALQEIPIKSLTRNENPLKKLERIDKPLTIKQDQQEKQVINTIREVPPEMYTPAHLLIPPQDKLSLFRKHIPKQQEIDALLKNLRKLVLHNLMVNLDTKDLIESYTKSLRYREIYNYIADGRLPGNAITQKKIVGEAANYVVVNGLLFKIAQHKESGKWTHYLLLVIPEKFEANILNMYHNSLLAMHRGPYHTFLTMRKQFYFPNMLSKIQKYIEACTLCQRTKPKNTKQQPYYGRIPIEYIPCENLAVDLKKMPMGIIYHELYIREERSPFELAFNHTYQFYAEPMVMFTNMHDQLLVNVPILLRLTTQKPLNLYSIDKVPMPFDTETLDGKNNEYTFINNSYPYMALNKHNYIPLTETQLRMCDKWDPHTTVKTRMCCIKEPNTHVNQPYTIKWMLKRLPSTARQNLQQM